MVLDYKRCNPLFFSHDQFMFTYMCCIYGRTRLNIDELSRLEHRGELWLAFCSTVTVFAQVKPWYEKSVHFYRKCLIMYGISQVHRVHSRLATGPGGLKPIWILAPVAVRFPGCYTLIGLIIRRDMVVRSVFHLHN